MTNKVQNFEMIIDDFKKKVEEIAIDSKRLESFLSFCVELNKNIELKIKHGDSNIYTNFLSQLLHSNREFSCRKKFFGNLCEHFQFEFLLLYDLRKDETIF